MASRIFTNKDGISDLQLLIVELEKEEPDSKVIKALTSKYGIPYKNEISEQLNELLTYLNGLSVPFENEPNQET